MLSSGVTNLYNSTLGKRCSLYIDKLNKKGLFSCSVLNFRIQTPHNKCDSLMKTWNVDIRNSYRNSDCYRFLWVTDNKMVPRIFVITILLCSLFFRGVNQNKCHSIPLMWILRKPKFMLSIYGYICPTQRQQQLKQTGPVILPLWAG